MGPSLPTHRLSSHNLIVAHPWFFVVRFEDVVDGYLERAPWELDDVLEAIHTKLDGIKNLNKGRAEDGATVIGHAPRSAGRCSSLVDTSQRAPRSCATASR